MAGKSRARSKAEKAARRALKRGEKQVALLQATFTLSSSNPPPTKQGHSNPSTTARGYTPRRVINTTRIGDCLPSEVWCSLIGGAELDEARQLEALIGDHKEDYPLVIEIL